MKTKNEIIEAMITYLIRYQHTNKATPKENDEIEKLIKEYRIYYADEA
jgi:hypothetical protein